MIVGRGLVASYFEQYATSDLKNNYIIFASGISSSINVTDKNIKREFDLLESILNNTEEKKFIYFSSSFVGVVESVYYNHKLSVEQYIMNSTDNALIVRIPQLVGCGGNVENLFNFLVHNIKNSLQITTTNKTFRSLLDVYDLVRFVDSCKWLKGIINFSHVEIISVVDMCNIIGDVVGILPILNVINNEPQILIPKNTNIVEHTIKNMNIDIIGYNKKVIQKYTKRG
jgi:nucleoside-diphosphate-sugar epimerase